MSDSASPAASEPNPGLYNWLNIGTYDLTVIWFSQRHVWRCPASVIRRLYADNIAADHLDIGPGTGYYLKKAPIPQGGRLHLLDLHEVPLRRAARRVTAQSPQLHTGDALQPFPIDDDSLGSVACSMMMHCMPGAIPSKAAMFDEVARVLRPGGRFFGATVLSLGVEVTPRARKVLDTYNHSWNNAFNNTEDSLEDLRREVADRFVDVQVRAHGSVGVWEASAK